MTLREDLEILFEKHKRSIISNTPEYILAKYLMECLTSFECAVGIRDSDKNYKKR